MAIHHVFPEGDDLTFHIREPNCQCMPRFSERGETAVFTHVDLTGVLGFGPYPHEAE